MTCAIVHRGIGNRIVLDCLLEKPAPFSPDQTVWEFSKTLKEYRVHAVRGDRYGGEWPRERFRVQGIAYEPAEMNRSELYSAFLPLLNSGRIDLLDNTRMIAQFVGLERRSNRSGKDSVDHAPGSHDDLSNAVAGALVHVGDRSGEALDVSDEILAAVSRPDWLERPYGEGNVKWW